MAERGPKTAATLALILIVTSLGSSVTATIVRSDLSPIDHGISFYAVGPYWYVQTAAILLVGTASIVLAAGLRRALRDSPAGVWGSTLVTLWGVCVLVAGLVPIDLTPPVSLSGLLHDAAGTAANLFLIAGILVLSGAFGANPSWAGFRTTSRAIAAVALIDVVLANLLRPSFPWGAGQRIYVGLLLAWLTLAALRLRGALVPAGSDGAG